MARTYLSTQEEVLAVEQKVDTANTAINAPDTGLGALNTSVQGLESGATSTNQRVTDLESAVGDEASGLVKAVTDIDNAINEADVGIKARITDLEQGGTTVTKFRTHTPSGKYEDGEVVQKDKALYKANSVIDGSSTPVPFVVGAGVNSWTPLDQKDPSTPLIFQTSSSGALTGMSPSSDGVFIQTLSNNVGGNSIGFQVDADRGRVAYMTNGVQAEIEPDDLLRKVDADSLYLKNTAQTVMGTAVYTSESTPWEKLIELGVITVSTRNDSSKSSQVLIQSSNTITMVWADNQGGGNISSIGSAGILWNRHDNAGTPRNIDLMGTIGGKEYNIKVICRLLNQDTPSQSVRCSVSITMV